MRGKPPDVGSEHDVQRNIPAYAGKTPTRFPRTACREEHPRVCGENTSRAPQACAWVGTSPRMRGKHAKAVMEVARKRNIPAYAGKTLIDVRFLVPEGHFTFGFIFPHHGGVKFILS